MQDDVAVENDQKVETGWAIKAGMHAESYYKTIRASPDPRLIRLTKIDDALYSDFRREFPKLDLRNLNEDELKSPEQKDKWRNFLVHYDQVIDDYNMGSLLRKNVDEEYSPDNAVLVPRTQFLCIELARNREGLNKPGTGEEEPSSMPQTIRLPRRDGGKADSDSERDSDLERESKTPAIRLANAARLKAAGNDYFKKGNLKRAERRYRKAWKEINDMDYLTDAQIAQRNELQVSVNANLALCLAKAQDYHGVLKACDRVLEVDANNVKALFRRGQAHLRLGIFEKAQEDLVAAAKLDPANADIRTELETLKREKADKLSREKQMFAKLFKPSPAAGSTKPADSSTTTSTSTAGSTPATGAPAAASDAPTPSQERPKPTKAYLEELPDSQ